MDYMYVVSAVIYVHLFRPNLVLYKIYKPQSRNVQILSVKNNIDRGIGIPDYYINTDFDDIAS